MTTTAVQTLTVVKHLAHGRDIAFAAAAAHLSEKQVALIGDEYGYPDLDRLAYAVDELTARVQKDAGALPAAKYAGSRPSTVKERKSRGDEDDHERGDAMPSPVDTPPPEGKVLTKPDEFRVLVNAGKNSSSKRTQARVERILKEFAELSALIEKEQAKEREKALRRREREAAEAEVRRLKEELQAARRKLYGTRSSNNTSQAGRSRQSAAVKQRHEHVAEILSRHHVTTDDVRSWAKRHGHRVKDLGMLPVAVVDAFDANHEPHGQAA